MFENEKNIEFLFEKLTNYKKLFKELILPREVVVKLIKKAKNYNQILTFLLYLGKDIVQFLQVIYQERELIKYNIKEEKKKK